MAIADQIRHQADEDEQSCCAEAGMPAVHLRQQPTDDRAQHRPDVDPRLEDRVGAHAVRFVVDGVERAHLCGDVALEESAAEDQERQRGEEALVERHGDVAGTHQHRARHDRVALANEAIGDPAAQDRRQIYKAAVESENLRRERLRRHRPEHTFQRRAKPGEARDVLDMARQQKLIDHIQHDQGSHAVIGEALPRFGGGQVVESLRLPENAAHGRARFANHRCRAAPHSRHRGIVVLEALLYERQPAQHSPTVEGSDDQRALTCRCPFVSLSRDICWRASRTVSSGCIARSAA